MSVNAFTIRFVALEAAFKCVTIYVIKNAEAICLPQAPSPSVPGSVGPYLRPVPVLHLVDLGELPRVGRAIIHQLVNNIVDFM